MNLQINKPIPLKVCSVNEEYEIDDTEVDQLQAQLKEAYKKIISDNTKQSIAGGSYCGNCRSLVGYHNDYCIVLKAEKWLKENN